MISLAGDVEVNQGFQYLTDIGKKRGLKIAHLNVRSLRKKIVLVRLEQLNNNTVDVPTMSETGLNDSISDIEIQLPGFACVRRDRKGSKSGGGVAI